MATHTTTEPVPTCEDLEAEDYDGAFGQVPAGLDDIDDDTFDDDEDSWW